MGIIKLRVASCGLRVKDKQEEKVNMKNTSWFMHLPANASTGGAAFAWQPCCPILGLKDLGQRFCVPAFRLVCLFQAKVIIGKKVEGLKTCVCHFPAEYAHDEIVGLLGLKENDKGHNDFRLWAIGKAAHISKLIKKQ